MENKKLFRSGAGRPIRGLLLALLTLALVQFVLPVTASANENTASYPVGGSCNFGACAAQEFSVTTDGVLRAEVAVQATCITAQVQFSLDGVLAFTSEPIADGTSTGVVDLGPVAPGTHTLSVVGSPSLSITCDSRFWTGTLSITTSGVSNDDVAYVNPGATATVSTAVSGSPRPAGITATLTRSATATTNARLSVLTYDGFPSALPSGPPIRAAAYLDLQLTNPNLGDSLVGEFLPPNPILPPNPVLPPNPILPPNPVLPPNPIRLAYWDGAAWSPVFDNLGNLPTYSASAEVFTVTFGVTSTPKITALGGTVFAAIPGYYFRGFGTPLDSGVLNIAKAGRAIPLKWQVFDYTAAAVEDLDPAVVRVSSIAIPCQGSSAGTDEIEEYATGGSALQYQGDGIYQLNWDTSKSYAGTCRRLRLDLGERNPDGTTFYRTADFQFKR